MAVNGGNVVVYDGVASGLDVASVGNAVVTVIVVVEEEDVVVVVVFVFVVVVNKCIKKFFSLLPVFIEKFLLKRILTIVMKLLDEQADSELKLTQEGLKQKFLSGIAK